MNTKKILLSTARKTPGIGGLIKENELSRNKILSLNREINELKRLNQRLEAKILNAASKKRDTLWPIFVKDLLKVDFNNKCPAKPPLRSSKFLILNWVVLSVNVTSGGQEDIFRTIEYLSKQGHDCRIYVYDVNEKSDKSEQERVLNTRFPDFRASLEYNSMTMRDCDIIFATHWLTAYPVYNFEGHGKKIYFVQDYEPYFEPMGYMHLLAEKTYSFGFKGLTLGRWLAEKLSQEYGMECDYFNFGYDDNKYWLPETQRSDQIACYVRPQTPRRGLELMVSSLEIFHRKHPGVKINLFGADLSNYKIPFPCKKLGVITTTQLNKLYGKCRAGFVISFTNMSLIPLEMLAAGCVPVVNDAEHTRVVRYAKDVIYADPTPEAMADALSRTVKDGPRLIKSSLEKMTWNISNQAIERLLIKVQDKHGEA